MALWRLLRHAWARERLLLGARQRTVWTLFWFGTITAVVDVVGVLSLYPVVAVVTNQTSILSSPLLHWLTAVPRWLVPTVYLGLFVFRSLLTVWYQIAVARFAVTSEKELRVRLFDNCLRGLPVTHFSGKSQAKSMAAVGYVCQQWSSTLVGVFNGTYQVTMGCILVVFFFAMDPFATAIAGIIFVMIFLVYNRGLKVRIKHAAIVGTRTFEKFLAILEDVMGSLKEIRLLNRELVFLGSFEEVAEERAKASKLHYSLLLIPRPLSECVLVGLVMVMAGYYMYQYGDVQTFYPKLGLFAMASMRLLPAFNQIVAMSIQLREHVHLVSVLSDFLALPDLLGSRTSSQQRPSTGRIAALTHGLEMADVSFEYEENRPVLKEVSLQIPAGKITAVVGKSGEGKSTLADLIAGFLKPGRGSILVDGKSIYDDLGAWQRGIAYMPQNACLMDASIVANITLSLDLTSVDQEALQQALRKSQLQDFVDSLPDGLATSVGERGARLSGGQRQRVGLARALYHKRHFLIFDEPTSSLDSDTTKQVEAMICDLRGSHTVLVITHNRSLAAICDSVLAIEDGQIKRLPSAI